MKTIHKNKSRTRLWDAIAGVNEITGVAGEPATAAVVLADNPTADEVMTITAADGTVTTFTFVASSAAEDQITIGGTLTATVDNAITILLAHSVTGAWGYLYPDDTVGLVNTAGTTITITFYPGTWANSLSISGTAVAFTGEPFVPTGGLALPALSTEAKWNTVDTTGNAGPKVFYALENGDYVGEECNVLFKLTEASDTPTIIGNLKSIGTAYVEALVAAGEDGKAASFVWDGSHWVNTNDNLGTALAFTAA